MKSIELTDIEIEVLNAMCKIAVRNSNSVEEKAYIPDTSAQYRALCKLWNKINGKG